MAKRGWHWRVAVRIVCALALALALAAFAHRLAAVDTGPDLSAYTLPDGALPVLCRPGVNGGQGKDMAENGPCAFCRIAGSVLLPPPPPPVEVGCILEGAAPLPVVRVTGAPPRRERLAAAPTRGPPAAA